jgi:hypothetical protein
MPTLYISYDPLDGFSVTTEDQANLDCLVIEYEGGPPTITDAEGPVTIDSEDVDFGIEEA